MRVRTKEALRMISWVVLEGVCVCVGVVWPSLGLRFVMKVCRLGVMSVRCCGTSN